MSGFPNKPSRTDFGPEYENEFPVRNPKREMGEDIVNLLMWQVAGAGVVAPKAVLVVSHSGSTVTTTHQLLAFDPNSSVSPIPWVDAGTGQYAFTFADKYPDQNGNDQNLDLKAGIAFAQGSSPRLGSVDLTSGYEGEVFFETDAGAAVDVDEFIVVLW